MTTETPKAPKRYPVPEGRAATRCRSCQAPIIWTTNPATGSHIPLSVATIQDGTAASHYTDCPHAKAWSQKKRETR